MVVFPESVEAFASRLADLRELRKRKVDEVRTTIRRRSSLSPRDRERILQKTDGRCHLCGGAIEGTAWDADHVLAHSGGGAHAVDNYLPAHRLCNNYRWHYSPGEFRQILKLGVWARTQIERRTKVGQAIGERFLAYERNRMRRRKRKQ